MKQTILLILCLFVGETLLAQTLSLSDYLSKVDAQNVEIKIEKLKTDSAEARSQGLAIPPPMLGFSQMKAGDEKPVYGFEVNQTIPFANKLLSDKKTRMLELEAQSHNQKLSKNQTLQEAQILFYQVWQSQQKLKWLENKKNILLNHIKISRSTARSDSFLSIHLLKSESDLDFLENEIETIQQLIREKQFELALYTNEDSQKYLNIKALEPALTEIPSLNNFEKTTSFQIQKINLEILKSKEAEAQSNWWPEFNLKYRKTPAMGTLMKQSEFMLGLTLPFLYFWEPRSQAQQARVESLIAETEFKKQNTQFNVQKEILHHRVTSLKKQIENIKNKLIPRAEKRMRLIQNITPRDAETLQDHKEAMESLPDLQIKLLDLRIDYEQTLVEFKKINFYEDAHVE
jgi:outer membrane protein TolC